MTVINRQPQGILGFLGIKNGGRFPQTFGDVLLPSWEMRELYLNTDPQYADVAATTGAGGYELMFQPPPGEVWWILEGGVYWFTGAGLTWSGHLSRSSPNNAVVIPLSELISLTGAARSQAVYPRDLILAPGENLGFSTTTTTGGATNVYAAIRYAVLTT